MKPLSSPNVLEMNVLYEAKKMTIRPEQVRISLVLLWLPPKTTFRIKFKTNSVFKHLMFIQLFVQR